MNYVSARGEHFAHDPTDNLRTTTSWRRAVGVLALTAAVSPLVACGAEDAAATATVQATTYHGRDLLCRVQTAPRSSLSYECDFDGFYNDPKYQAPSSVPRIADGTFSEVSTPFKNGSLHCLVYEYDNTANAFGETCDYARFYQEQKHAE